MPQGTGSIDLPHDGLSIPGERPARPARPLGLPAMMFSVVLIGAGAIAVACIGAVAAVLCIFYVRGGGEGLADFYEELRFDFRLKTLIGAMLVSALYIGVAGATIGAALWRGRREWPKLLALGQRIGNRRITIAITVATLLYAAVATLAMAWLRTHRVIVAGATDLVLLSTITANLVLLAPIAEELFFRGWLYTGLRARLSFWPSFLATAALFAGIHWDSGHRRIFLVLPLAVALGALREVTGSIRPTIALHASYNLIIVVITLLET